MADDGQDSDILADISKDHRKGSPRSYAAAVVSHAEGKIFFNVPFEQKEVARAAGLRWDPAVRKWYAPNAKIAESFSAYTYDEVVAQTVQERFYFDVPFLQKDHAKALGMRFDSGRKCWFAQGAAIAAIAACSFRPLGESAARN